MPALRFIAFVSALLIVIIAPAAAQRTVTKDAGSGRKIVLHYNAADQITENDTLGPNGELLEKDVLEYRPNAYVANTLDTSYWPNGKPHKISHHTYDDNSNFTGEFIQVYDESGKQISGHRLTHDPQGNTYRCEDWNTATQNYVLRQCPAGEESQGAPETAKKFTQQEVEQQLTRARQAVKAPAPAGTPAGTAQMKEVGVVLPSHIRVGERVSGSVVGNPADYENMPQVTVTRFSLPFAATGQGSTLAGWSVLLSGEPPQPADGPIDLTIPPGQVELAMMFQQAGATEGKPIAHAIPIPPASRDRSKGPTMWEAPAMCVKGSICMVHGVFTGNSTKTFAAFSEQPAKIVAETTTAVYLAVPAATEGGSRPLVVAEGGKAVAFPMVISVVGIQPDRRTLKAGEQLVISASIDGAEELPDSEWRPGNFPPSNLEEARKLVQGYQLPRAKKEDHEAEERREKAAKNGGKKNEPEAEEDLGGEILLVVKATSADGLNFRGSNNGTYVFRLHHGGFSMGGFKYKFVVDAPKGGSFAVQETMIPMLAPMPGQEFVDPGASK